MLVKKERYTPLKARLQSVKDNARGIYNWVFLAGGPGLGSESLAPLIRVLDLPGTTWCLDLPGDGSNLTSDDALYFSKWQEALIEAVTTLDNVILVGHSTGGMYIQATAELESLIVGLVLMDSAPNVNWREQFHDYMVANPLPELEKCAEAYGKNPNNETLKQLTIAAMPYSFTEKGVKLIADDLKTWPFNHAVTSWSDEHFDPTYKATWIPKNIPTLIFAGSEDHIIPLTAFSTMAEYHRENIMLHTIAHAGHFPWVENPDAVSDLFACLVARL